MDTITVAVTIIVCAVPEGLPMLTSILLSLQSMRMAKDNVLVHKINGLETAGSLSILVVCEIYRKNGEWKFNAVAAGYQGGLEALCRNYGVLALLSYQSNRRNKP